MRRLLIALLLSLVACGPKAVPPTASTPAATASPPTVAPPSVVATAEAPVASTPSVETERADDPLVSAADDNPSSEQEPELSVSSTGLGVIELKAGRGAEAKAGDRVTVHYVGKLDSGKEFDSSRQRQRPFTFELGSGMVIAGWDEGVVGMREGGVRRLLIPPTLGYGSRGAPPSIPPNAILEFEIELLAIEAAP